MYRALSICAIPLWSHEHFFPKNAVSQITKHWVSLLFIHFRTYTSYILFKYNAHIGDSRLQTPLITT